MPTNRLSGYFLAQRGPRSASHLFASSIVQAVPQGSGFAMLPASAFGAMTSDESAAAQRLYARALASAKQDSEPAPANRLAAYWNRGRCS